MTISVGTVSVSVIPDVQRFSSAARSKLVPEGERLGDSIGKAMADRINAKLKGVHDAKVGADTTEARVALDRLNAKLDETAVKAKLAGDAAGGAGGGFGAMGGAMGAAIAAGVALSPVLVTVGAGLGGLGLAAISVVRNTKEMNGILAPLKGELNQFSTSLRPEVLGIFGEGVKIAGVALHDLEPVAAATGKAMEGLLSQIGAGVNSAQFRSFFTWMAQQAGPDVQMLGGLFIDLVKDLVPLLKDLQPLATELIGLADGALKTIGALEKFHVLLPLIGVAAGALAGGPIGALIGGIAGLTAQAAAANQQLNQTGLHLDHLTPKYVAVSKQMVGYADVAGQVAANLKIGAVPAALAASAGDRLAAAFANAATNTSTLDTQWNILVGNFNGKQGALVAAEQAVASFGQAVHQSGAKSLNAQSAFYSAVSSIQALVDADAKSHAPARQVYNDIQSQINALRRKGPLNAAEKADLNRLQGAANGFANSTLGLNKNLLTAAGTVQNRFTANLLKLGKDTPGINRDVANLSNSILQTGVKSQATQGNRAKLIKDLEKSGLSAKGATKLVDGLQKKIDKLHGKNVGVNVNATGTGGALVKASGIQSRLFHLEHLPQPNSLARGGLITSGTGPTADDVPALVSRGETVVSARHSRMLAPAFKALGVPGYARGGTPAGLVDFAAGQEASWVGSQEASWVKQTLTAMSQQFIKNTLAAFNVPNSGAGVSRWLPLVHKALVMEGLNTLLARNVLYQMQSESGGNPNAINLWDSNAKAGHPSQGLMQLIPGTFSAYHWPGTSWNIRDPLANIAAALNYAMHRYGPTLMRGGMGIGSGHGYAMGGNAASGWHVVGEQGPELVNFGRTTRVYNANQTKQIAGNAKGSLIGGDLNVNVAQSGASAGDIIDAAVYELRKMKVGGVYA